MSSRRTKICYYEPSLPKPRELESVIDDVITGELAGIAIRSTQPRRFSSSVKSVAAEQASALLSERGFTSVSGGSIDFLQHPRIERLKQLANGAHLARLAIAEILSSDGITPLHADQDEGEQLISISELKKGQAQLDIFRRRAELADVPSDELFSELNQDTIRAIVDEAVDPARLSPNVTRLHVSQPGDIFVFNAQLPHMVTTLGTKSRRSTSTFFSQR